LKLPPQTTSDILEGRTGRTADLRLALLRARTGGPGDDVKRIQDGKKNGTILESGNVLTVNTPYRPPVIRAVDLATNQPLALVEPPLWRRGGGKGRPDVDTSLPDNVIEQPGPRVDNAFQLGGDQFRVDYVTGRVEFGFDLTNRRIQVDYNPVTFDPIVTEGVCAVGFDPATLQVNNPSEYARNDTIGLWLDKRIATSRGFLTGTRSERMIEFHINAGLQPVRVVDTRYTKAKSQYLAAGSFGPLQLTLPNWDHSVRRTYMNTEMRVDEGPSSGCLQRAATDVPLAFRLGAVRHAYSFTVANMCLGSCDQSEWAKSWSKVFELYNPPGEHYKVIHPGGYNDVIERGLKLYVPQ
jgi:hypothetical protein